MRGWGRGGTSRGLQLSGIPAKWTRTSNVRPHPSEITAAGAPLSDHRWGRPSDVTVAGRPPQITSAGAPL